jgi:hypothetical protein
VAGNVLDGDLGDADLGDVDLGEVDPGEVDPGEVNLVNTRHEGRSRPRGPHFARFSVPRTVRSINIAP